MLYTTTAPIRELYIFIPEQQAGQSSWRHTGLMANKMIKQLFMTEV